MIRLAKETDLGKIADTYTELLQYEEANGSHSNWKLNVYPTIEVPKNKVPSGTMYVLEENGEICASIPPQKAGNGYGRKMVEFAKEYALKHNCTVIRLDTYAHNEPAKKLYRNNGFQIAGYGQILLQGLIEEEQVYLECLL